MIFGQEKLVAVERLKGVPAETMNTFVYEVMRAPVLLRLILCCLPATRTQALTRPSVVFTGKPQVT